MTLYLHVTPHMFNGCKCPQQFAVQSALSLLAGRVSLSARTEELGKDPAG